MATSARRRGPAGERRRARAWTGRTQARELSRDYRETPRWRYADGDRAPRLGPHESIGRGMTRRGIFTTRDPLVVPRLWGRWHWLGFLGWSALAGGSLWRAWRSHGGPAPSE